METRASLTPDGIESNPSPTDLRRAVLEDLHARVPVGVPLFQGVEFVDDRAVFANLMLHGVPVSPLPDIDGTPAHRFAEMRISELPINAFGVLRADRAPGDPFVRAVRTPHGVHSSLWMVAQSAGRLVGYVCVLRAHGDPMFTEADLAAVSGCADLYRAALDRARRLELGAELALVALSPDGELVDWDAVGGELVRDPHLVAVLREMVLRWPTPERREVSYRHGQQIRLLELTGPGGARFCALLRRTQPVPLNELVLLSPAKREIAELAALGATANEIARALGRSAETVRTHLKQIYRFLGIGSRVELAARVQEVAWMRPPKTDD